METINVVESPVYFQESGFDALAQWMGEKDYTNVFVLVDSNTRKHCLPTFMNWFTPEVPVHILEVEAGEEHKNIGSCMDCWRAMSNNGADRNSLLVSLGGGVITDLGGFVASVYKRGIHFVHVPTSLLAMVDAAIGGKTGVDLDGLKNQLGVIRHPAMVLVHTAFLDTLPQRQFNNGMAEMWKHGLIRDREYWEAMKNSADKAAVKELIPQSVAIKAGVVNRDPEEKSIRKILNFGHTLGHAIESYFLTHGPADGLLHGEAIAIGMVMEAYLSVTYSGLAKTTADEIAAVLLNNYPKTHIPEEGIEPMIDLLKHDKKNRKGRVNFVLLNAIGEATINCIIPENAIREAFTYYREF